MANGAEMNELSIRLSVLNSKTFATKVIADIVSNGSKVKTYEQRLFNQISQPNIKRMAEDIKKLIDTNLKQGLKYTGGKVAPLAEATIEAKKRKGRRQPDRVFLDSGILFQSLRLVPIAKGFAVTFKKIKYPKSKLSVMEVAQFLVDGTPKMPARPFFGITESQLNKIISRHADARRVTVEPTPRQVEQAGRAIKLITGFDPLKVQVIKSEGLKAATVQTENLAVQEVVTTLPKVASDIQSKTYKTIDEVKKDFKDVFKNKAKLNIQIGNIDEGVTLDKITKQLKAVDKILTEYEPASWANKLEQVELSFEKKIAEGYGSIRQDKGIIEYINLGSQTDPGTYKYTNVIGRADDKSKWIPEKELKGDYDLELPKSRVDADNVDIATTVHEMMHIMGVSDTDFAKDYFKELNEIKDKYTDEYAAVTRSKMPFKKIYKWREQNDLGDYALANIDEFHAEALTEYFLRSSPSTYALKVGQLFDKFFKRQK